MREKYKFLAPTLVFTFDDGYATDYSRAFPTLQKHGIKGTTYLTSRVGNSGWITWEQAKEMADSGWDFQGHGIEHPNNTHLTDDELHAEYQGVMDFFIDNGLENPEHWAVPYGSTNKRVNDVIKQYFKTNRITDWKYSNYFNDYKTVDYYNMPALSCDNLLESEEGYQEIIEKVDRAVLSGKILILYFYHIYDERKDNFERLCDYIGMRGLRTSTISEMYDFSEIYRNKHYK